VSGLFVSVADKIVRTLGEGTFGKVVECMDVSRSVSMYTALRELTSMIMMSCLLIVLC